MSYAPLPIAHRTLPIAACAEVGPVHLIEPFDNDPKNAENFGL
jgi:hypothetical protein